MQSAKSMQKNNETVLCKRNIATLVAEIRIDLTDHKPYPKT